MNGTPALYCLACRAFRAIGDWHERERGDTLVIELAPCRHVLYRSAAVEWPV